MLPLPFFFFFYFLVKVQYEFIFSSDSPPPSLKETEAAKLIQTIEESADREGKRRGHLCGKRRYKPGWWLANKDGRPATYLASSHGQRKPQGLAGSWTMS
jgi:hypothetical protein